MATIEIEVPDDAKDAYVMDVATDSAPVSAWAQRVFAVARIFIGWTFLWAFLDKSFGLGYATESENAWIDGGSPTNGFLSFATKGPLDGLYQSFAGDPWADWLFMIGLLGIGLALMLGIGMRIATISAALLLTLMWSAVLPPENNPFMDDHLIEATLLIGLLLVNAGDTLGFGRWWKQQSVVRRFPILR